MTLLVRKHCVGSDLKNVTPEATRREGVESVLLQPPEAPSSHNNPPTPSYPAQRQDQCPSPKLAPGRLSQGGRGSSQCQGAPPSPPCLAHLAMPPRLQSSVPSFQGEQGTRGEGEAGTQKGGRSRSSVKEQKGSQCPDGKFLSCAVVFRGQEFLGCEIGKRSSSPAPLWPLD